MVIIQVLLSLLSTFHELLTAKTNGAAGQNWTGDLFITSELLYPWATAALDGGKNLRQRVTEMCLAQKSSLTSPRNRRFFSRQPTRSSTWYPQEMRSSRLPVSRGFASSWNDSVSLHLEKRLPHSIHTSSHSIQTTYTVTPHQNLDSSNIKSVTQSVTIKAIHSVG